MRRSMSSLWWRDSNQTASGKPGAVQGHQVCCLELSLQQLDDVALGHAELVAVYVGMHTAARIAAEALPRIRALAPQAHVSVYGLYAPMNDGLFRSLGAKAVFGGEVEPHLLSLAD